MVAAINHPGDNSFDESRVDNLSVFEGRPADITRLLNFMLGGRPDELKIDRERIGLFGILGRGLHKPRHHRWQS